MFVDCSGCGFGNLEGARFCGGCGASLAIKLICAGCGAENRSEQRFCSACGHALSDPPEGLSEEIAVAQAEVEGERKQVTVMFVDIVGSMVLAESLDPERWRGLLDRFFALASEAVRSVGGTVDKFTGDGVMALFGAPVSFEDHARRACLAALELHASLAVLAGELAVEGVGLAVRVGLNSGEVIVGGIGDEGRMDYTAIGHTVGLAQRMESLAPAGSTALSAASAALVAGEFELGGLGEFEVRGSSAPQRVFRLGRALSGDRVGAAGARGGLSRFVGREREQAALQAALERALEGDGQVVGLVGEPGVGKSRLAHEFLERCAAEGISVGRARAVAHRREVPLLPMLDLWRSTLGVTDTDQPPVAREQIVERLAALDVSFEEDLPLLFDFLGVGDPERPVPKVDPDARQRQLLGLVRRFVQARSRVQPGVTLVEDLHWLDDSSGVFLAELVRACAGTRTLLILTYRPEYHGELLRGSHCEQLALRPLAKSAVEELLGSLLGGDASLDGLGGLIAARAVGNPFFCEELVAALAESGHLVGERGSYRLGRTLEEVVLPGTVQATLAARIDRLAEREKELLEIASVIGFELSLPLLRAVCGLGDRELGDGLDTLVSAELLTERAGESGVEFLFKHPLTQEVAYRSQLSGRRRHVHRDVAQAIEQLDPDRLDERAALVAQHWEAAGDPLAAARWSARAAAWVGLGDIAQAIGHWRKVSQLTKGLPDSPETTGLALVSHVRQLDYGWRLGITEEEAAAHYQAGREIAQRSGDRVNLLLITTTYGAVRGFAGHVEEYARLSEEANRVSIEIADPALRLAVLPALIWSSLAQGRLGEALAWAEEGIALGAEDPTLGAGIGLACPYAYCLLVKGILLSFMGQLEGSASALERGLRVAQEQGDLETQGWTHMNYVLLARYTGQTETVLDHATQGGEIAERSGSAQSRVLSLSYLGFAHLMLGEAGKAIAAFERGIELARRARTGLEQEAFFVAGLSEALLNAGHHLRALETAQESVTLALQRGNQGYLPNCYRVLADALLATEDPGNITTAQQALENATAAVEATGARAELPFIERARQRLTPVS